MSIWVDSYGLLAPRIALRLRVVPGAVELLDPGYEDAIQPMVITEKDPLKFIGFETGGRGCLTYYGGGEGLKYKGLAIEPALESGEEYYRDARLENIENPRGGLRLGAARNEVDCTRMFGDILEREGFVFPTEPKAIIHYGIKFAPRTHLRTLIEDFTYMESIGFLKRFGHWFSDVQELACTVMKTMGDTRLPELYQFEVRNQEAADESVRSLGVCAGAQKRVTEDEILWSTTSSHVGNLMVFPHDGNIHLSMTDFVLAEEVDRYTPKERKREERQRIPRTLNRDGRGLVTGFRRPQSPVMAPEYFKKAFRDGFDVGYNNPDSWEPVPFSLFEDAFHLDNCIEAL